MKALRSILADAGGRLLAWMLVVVLASIAGFAPSVRTPKGVHCPTAEVQLVKATIETRDCCGKIVRKTVLRKPTSGEKGFKQCACAEKKSSAAHADASSTDGGKTGFSLIIPIVGLQLVLPHLPESVEQIHLVDDSLQKVDRAPLIPPP